MPLLLINSFLYFVICVLFSSLFMHLNCIMSEIFLCNNNFGCWNITENYGKSVSNLEAMKCEICTYLWFVINNIVSLQIVKALSTRTEVFSILHFFPTWFSQLSTWKGSVRWLKVSENSGHGEDFQKLW